MLSKFSVKKPLTIFVSVVIVLVLGVISFLNMTPDLLPNINLPYAMVMTTYIGATPEEVESEITQPLEQAFATMENIDSITSQSSENYSIVVLSFASDADMDVAMLDISTQIDMVSGDWDDMVGSPVIMEISMDSTAMAQAGVSMEGYDIIELTEFVNDTLLNELEGIDGMASVATVGDITQEVQVILDQDMIDAVNQTIQDAILAEFDDAQTELDDGKAQLQDGITELEDGIDEVESGKTELTEAQAEAAATFIETENTLNTNKADMETMIVEFEVQIADLEVAVEETNAAITALDEAIAGVEGYSELMDAIALLEYQLTLLDPTYFPEEYATATATLAALQEQATLAQEGFTEAGMDVSDPAAAIATLQEQQAAAQAGVLEMEAGIVALEDGIVELEAGIEAIEAGLLELQLTESTTNFTLSATLAELITTSSTLTSTLTELEAAESELDDAQTQIDDAKEEALDAADMTSVITMDMVSQILSAQSFSMPAGYALDDEDNQVLVRVGDEIEDYDELSGLLLFDLGIDGVDPIYLSDVAQIFVLDTSSETYTKINGDDGILLQFTKQSTAATADVSTAIANTFEELEEKYEGLSFTMLIDQGDYIDLIVDSVSSSLIVGALLAILILLFFLKDWRPTLITACSIPISVVFAIVLMYFSGITLNIISMSGLAVGVGMLVDNSVVVIENIYRLRAKGVSAAKAAVAGATQVAGAITASTLTTVCVFAPIVFVEGITRQLFQDMALTIGYSLMASLIVALTLVPAMSRGMLKHTKSRNNRLMDKVVAGYEKSIRFSLKHRSVVLVLAIVIMIVSVPLSLSRGFSFMPAIESEQISVTVTMDEDNDMETSAAIADQIAEITGAIDGVEAVGSFMGSTSSIMGYSTGDDGYGSVMMYVMLEDGYSSDAIAQEIEDGCADLDAEVVAEGSVDMTSMMSALSGSGVSMTLYGNDLDTLTQTATEIAEIIAEVEGVDSVSDGMEDATPEISIEVDKNAAMAEGLTVAQIYIEIASVLTSESIAFDMPMDNVSADVVVSDNDMDARTVEGILNYEFTVTATDGTETTVALTDIATITETESLSSISRIDQRRYMTVSATVNEEYNVTLVSSDVQGALADYELPDGVSLEYSGENETIMEAMWELVKMLLLAVALIYLIMVAQFQSLKSPLIIMFTVPLAFTGGLLALWITGFEVSVISMIGFVMLSGIIVNNGIVLVDYINQLRGDGMGKFDAIVEAGKTRMRPILMTALTTILGLSVMAIGMGTGSEMMQPIAIVCVGGLIYATIMTLYVVPAMYDVFNRKEEYKVLKDEDLEYTEM